MGSAGFVSYDAFEEKVKAFANDLARMLISKNADYADGTNALSGFESTIGLQPAEVWHVYFAKHVKALERYVRDGQLATEPLRGRAIDVAAYAFLLTLIDEARTDANGR